MDIIYQVNVQTSYVVHLSYVVPSDSLVIPFNSETIKEVHIIRLILLLQTFLLLRFSRKYRV